MSETLDLRRSIRIMRRHKLLMGVAVALGSSPAAPMPCSNRLWSRVQRWSCCPRPGKPHRAQPRPPATTDGPDPLTETQEVIAKSSPVLLAALPHVRPAMSLNQLRDNVTIGSQTSFIISVSAQAKDAADAAATANAVAKSYITYIGSPGNPGGKVQAQLLQPAASGTGSGVVKQIAHLCYLWPARRDIRCDDRSHHSAGRQPQRPAAQGSVMR